MKKIFTVLFVSSVFMNLSGNAQNEPSTADVLLGALKENIVTPVQQYVDSRGGVENIVKESLKEGSEWAQEKYAAIKQDAQNKVTYLLNELPQDARDLLSDEEWELVKQKLSDLKTEAAAYNTQTAEYFGLPENIMGGILLSLGFVGIKASIPAIKTVVPLLPSAVQYGALAGTGYSVYQALQAPLSKLPVYASRNTISTILDTLKDWVLESNKAVAGKLGVSPYATGLAGAAIGAVAIKSAVSTARTALYWGRAGVYLAIAWPVLRWTYDFTNQALERVEKRRATKEQAQAILSAATQAVNNAQGITEEILKDEL